MVFRFSTHQRTSNTLYNPSVVSKFSGGRKLSEEYYLLDLAPLAHEQYAFPKISILNEDPISHIMLVIINIVQKEIWWKSFEVLNLSTQTC